MIGFLCSSLTEVGHQARDAGMIIKVPRVFDPSRLCERRGMCLPTCRHLFDGTVGYSHSESLCFSQVCHLAVCVLT